MNNKIVCLALTSLLVAFSFTASPLLAQGTNQAVAEYGAWIGVLADFSKGVKLDESNVQDIIEYGPQMDSLDFLDDDEDVAADKFAEELAELLDNAQYTTWARSNGLDPEDWLRNWMRYSALMVKRQMEATQVSMQANQEVYHAQVEQGCKQVDAATCSEMRDAYAESVAMSNAMVKAVGKLPTPTTREAALLDQYGSQLEAILMSDEEDHADTMNHGENYDDGCENYDMDCGGDYDEEYQQ